MPFENAPLLPPSSWGQLRLAENIQRQLDSDESRAAKRGRPRTKQSASWGGFLQGDSFSDLDAQLGKVGSLVGQRTRGNKRIGKVSLYIDLFRCFAALNRRGISLPTDHLSARAIEFGLGEALRYHGYTEDSDQKLRADSRARRAVAQKLKGVFAQVARAVKSPP